MAASGRRVCVYPLGCHFELNVVRKGSALKGRDIEMCLNPDTYRETFNKRVCYGGWSLLVAEEDVGRNLSDRHLSIAR
jgi:hypothetical protein